jgi:hypothetical protein
MRALLAEGNDRRPLALDGMFESENPEDGTRVLSPISTTVQPFLQGETFYVPVGGGAGYGDPLERDPEAVLKDLREGIGTEWSARNIYRVAYDAESLRLDREGTEALRQEARNERKRKGVPCAEFEPEWRKLRPPETVLKYFGSYPHPSRPEA